MASNGSGNGPYLAGPSSLKTRPDVGEGEGRWYYEHGRWYDKFRKGKYMFPCDEDEMNRLDIFHKLFTVCRSRDLGFGGLHQRHLPPNPRIIDLGCGSGIWTVDMAERYGPNADILGWDLVLTQPRLIPQGVRYEQRDIEEYWTGVEPDSRDLIHMRTLAGSISNWPALYQQIFRHLKPGTGILEQVELDYRPLLEDGELPPDSKLLLWARWLNEAMEKVGRPMYLDQNTRGILEQNGYVDVQHEYKRIPFNTWPADEHDKAVGRWFNLGMTQGIASLTMAPFTRVNGYTESQVHELLAEVKREICNRQLRTYCILHIYTARKPAPYGQSR